MAVINDADNGARVIIADKANTMRSGSGATGNDHFCLLYSGGFRTRIIIFKERDDQMESPTVTKVEISPKLIIIYVAKILSGPLAFLIVSSLPLTGLEWKGKLCLAVFAWVIAWWMLQPMPWGVTSLLPLIMFPVLGIMNLKGAAAIYGQNALFLVMSVLLVGYACKKHGLGQRFAIAMLSLGWVKGSVMRFVFVYMVVTFSLAVVVHSAAIAIVLPIGLATIDFIINEYKKKGITTGVQKLGTIIALGALYATEGGFMVTPTSTVNNAISLSLLEEVCGVTITYFQWMQTGAIMGVIGLILSYYVLHLLYKPEVDIIPGGVEYFRERKKELGKMKYTEKTVILILVTMVVLWILPSFVKVKWMDLYWVAIAGSFIMFLIPADVEKGEGILTSKDFLNSNWNILLLVGTGVGLASALDQFGVVKYVAGHLNDISGIWLILISSLVTPIITNFIAGAAAVTAMGTIVYPIIENIGVNPAVIARITASMATGLIFPWAGIAAAMAFSSGLVSMKDMIKTGMIVTLIYCVVVTLGSVIMVPMFHAYTLIK